MRQRNLVVVEQAAVGLLLGQHFLDVPLGSFDQLRVNVARLAVQAWCQPGRPNGCQKVSSVHGPQYTTGGFI